MELGVSRVLILASSGDVSAAQALVAREGWKITAATEISPDMGRRQICQKIATRRLVARRELEVAIDQNTRNF